MGSKHPKRGSEIAKGHASLRARRKQAREEQRLKLPSLLAGEPLLHRGEDGRAILACNAYLRYGPRRSLTALAKSLYEQALEKSGIFAHSTSEEAIYRQLSEWSRLYGWVARADHYDAEVEEARNARAQEILETGFARVENRVLTLNELTSRVVDALAERGLYGETTKSLGKHGIVREEVFRSDEIRQLRGLLDDLAKETGGRRQTGGSDALGVAGLLSSAKGFDTVEGEGIEDAVWFEVEPGTEPED